MVEKLLTKIPKLCILKGKFYGMEFMICDKVNKEIIYYVFTFFQKKMYFI